MHLSRTDVQLFSERGAAVAVLALRGRPEQTGGQHSTRRFGNDGGYRIGQFMDESNLNDYVEAMLKSDMSMADN